MWYVLHFMFYVLNLMVCNLTIISENNLQRSRLLAFSYSPSPIINVWKTLCGMLLSLELQKYVVFMRDYAKKLHCVILQLSLHKK